MWPKLWSVDGLEFVPASVPKGGEPNLSITEFATSFHSEAGIVLPVELSLGSHVIPFGFADDLESACELAISLHVTLRMKVHNYTVPDEYAISLNGQLLPPEMCRTRAQFIMDDFTWITYPLPLDWLKLGQNELVIDVKQLNPQISATPRLDNLEIVVEYV